MPSNSLTYSEKQFLVSLIDLLNTYEPEWAKEEPNKVFLTKKEFCYSDDVSVLVFSREDSWKNDTPIFQMCAALELFSINFNKKYSFEELLKMPLK